MNKGEPNPNLNLDLEMEIPDEENPQVQQRQKPQPQTETKQRCQEGIKKSLRDNPRMSYEELEDDMDDLEFRLT